MNYIFDNSAACVHHLLENQEPDGNSGELQQLEEILSEHFQHIYELQKHVLSSQ